MDEAPLWIDKREELDRWVARAARASRLAVDTEANGFHAYRPRLCLIQLAFESPDAPKGLKTALVDPIALRGDLGPLQGLLEDPGLETCLHGADYDVRLLHRDAGTALRGLYDTQIAAALASRRKTGLAALAEEITGVRLNKQAQKIDWSARPLPAKGLRYAAEDVEVVLPIRDALGAEIDSLGRADWVAEENKLLEEVRAAPEVEPDASSLLSRVSGAGRLSPGRRAVLGAALLWREREAARRDVPTVHLAPSKTLLAAASRGARDVDGLVRAGLSRRLAERYGDAILEAFRDGAGAEPLPLPKPAAPPPGTSSEDGETLKALRSARNARARELDLDPGLLCPSAVLKELVREAPASREALNECGLKRWQADVFGERILRILRARGRAST